MFFRFPGIDNPSCHPRYPEFLKCAQFTAVRMRSGTEPLARQALVDSYDWLRFVVQTTCGAYLPSMHDDPNSTTLVQDKQLSLPQLFAVLSDDSAWHKLESALVFARSWTLSFKNFAEGKLLPWLESQARSDSQQFVEFECALAALVAGAARWKNLPYELKEFYPVSFSGSSHKFVAERIQCENPHGLMKRAGEGEEVGDDVFAWACAFFEGSEESVRALQERLFLLCKPFFEKYKEEIRKLSGDLRAGISKEMTDSVRNELFPRSGEAAELSAALGTDWTQGLCKLISSPGCIAMARHMHTVLDKGSSPARIANEEARRRLKLFVNSLSMDLGKLGGEGRWPSWTTLTPFYGEDVMTELPHGGGDVLFYLKSAFEDEWENFVERMGGESDEAFMAAMQRSEQLRTETRLWMSYRGQTLARTVRFDFTLFSH